MNPLKYSDIRNNNTKLTSLETDVAEKAVREATDAENDKTSPQEAKDKGELVYSPNSRLLI